MGLEIVDNKKFCRQWMSCPEHDPCCFGDQNLCPDADYPCPHPGPVPVFVPQTCTAECWDKCMLLWENYHYEDHRTVGKCCEWCNCESTETCPTSTSILQ